MDEDKLTLKYLLETEFNNDLKELMKDMLEHAIESEEYEVAAIIRDGIK
jgi:protein-arginine kinase activator protein McsA